MILRLQTHKTRNIFTMSGLNIYRYIYIYRSIYRYIHRERESLIDKLPPLKK